jgi:hypothetical protein
MVVCRGLGVPSSRGRRTCMPNNVKRLTKHEKIKRAMNRAMARATRALAEATTNWRRRDRDAWLAARWPAKVPWLCSKNCTGRHAHAPRLWCKTCKARGKLAAAYERLAPPAWRRPTPHGISGPASVRVRVDGARRAGEARTGSGQTPRRQLKDGRCRACKGIGRVGPRSQTCLTCDGSGGRRFMR